MEIGIDQHNNLRLRKVFEGVLLETKEGNAIGVCMRDDTLEINVLPNGGSSGNWWRVNMQTGRIENMKETCSDEGSSESSTSEKQPGYEMKDLGDGTPVRVRRCDKCGICPGNVDDCGNFGDPDCPYFGIGREEYERRYLESKNKE